MKIKLLSMEIHNFKGIRELRIDFDGCNTEIHGDNATGKTTIKDAFNWVLFGKNSEGKTDFGIKPLDADGNVIHRLETSVEVMFEVDGNPKQFKRTLNESWRRSRGAATETFTGNEASFFVNTVPKKKTEYMREINSIINEDLFKMITDPLYFNQINWKDRREMILEICGKVSDDDVFDKDEELLPLKGVLKGRTIDEFKSIITRDMKAINKELSVIPSQINEAELAKPTSTGLVDLKRKQELQSEISALDTKRNNVINGVEIVELQAERRNLLWKSKALKIKDKSETKAYKEMQEILATQLDVKERLKEYTFQVDRLDAKLKDIALAKKRLSADWDTEFAKTFFGSTCPTCGQGLPADILEQKKKAFNSEKAKKLDRIESELTAFKKDEMALQLQKATYTKDIQNDSDLLEELNNKFKAKEQECKQEINESIAEYNKAMDKIEQQTFEINEKIKNYDANSSIVLMDIEQKRSELNEELHAITVIEAGIEQEKKQNNRIQELMDRQKELSREYMDKERWLALAERFVITKVRMLNEKINKNFKYADFRLFTQNINGGIEETCEVTYKGVPFKDLNTAGRINVGLDIISTLSKYHGTIAPIFIDSAESVTKFIKTDSQKILLVVDKKYKELHVVKEN